MTTTNGNTQPGRLSRSRRRAIALLGAYLVVTAAIVLWPSPVDRGATGLINRIAEIVPVLTHARIEFAANIALFVPLGALLARILPRDQHLVVPAALVVTVGVESIQALLLAARTPSVLDIVANTTGACLGLLIVAGLEARRRPTQKRTGQPA